MSEHVTIVWFRRDLRLADNPALKAAAERGKVVPVYIWAPDEEGDWPPGAAHKWWLHRSLLSFKKSLAKHHGKLTIRSGHSLDHLRDLVKSTKATAVYWNRRYEPAAIKRDAEVKSAIRTDGLEARSFNASLLYEPWTVSTQQDKPYQVFTPFYKCTQGIEAPSPPCGKPDSFSWVSKWPKSVSVDSLELNPTIDWDAGLRETWTPGEDAAHKRLNLFLKELVTEYKESRDTPGIDGTSRLSPYLHHGELGPRQVWHSVRQHMDDGRRSLSAAQRKQCWEYLRELVWREFSYHILYHFPHMPTEPLKPKYKKFPWVDMRKGRHDLEVWQKGQTGYPLVDAGMRQLWEVGWMHNRVRMVVASFLIKDLRVHWIEGARWFWDTLVDADLANNTMGWQWAAGCGADAAPFFRIFNPTTQSERYDKQGDYIRRYVPELKDLPDTMIHEPSKKRKNVFDQAEFVIGEEYPTPMVDHKVARQIALEAFEAMAETS